MGEDENKTEEGGTTENTADAAGDVGSSDQSGTFSDKKADESAE